MNRNKSVSMIPAHDGESVDVIIAKVQRALSPDLLSGRWKVQTHPLEGHCYIAAEALWHLLGPDEWRPFCASYKDEGGKATHWWLEHRITGERADPTREQYEPDEPPYHIGKPMRFLTKAPSKRARIVIDRVMNYGAEHLAVTCGTHNQLGSNP